MTPRTFSRRFSGVECHSVDTFIDPTPDVIDDHTDYFGNRVVSFSIESLHQMLVVKVTSEVTVYHRGWLPGDHPARWEQVAADIRNFHDSRWLELQEYLQNSPRIRRGSAFAEYAGKSFTPDRPIHEAALDLTQRIHDDFSYDNAATDVHSTTEEAFEKRAGVCQDFAHVQIACLRSIGLPARYVSGYLRTLVPPGEQRLVGADESHAWVSLYAGQELGWIDLDPTNACASDIDHIPICIGRDYSDVSPMRGVVLGGGQTELNVSVDVEPIVQVS